MYISITVIHYINAEYHSYLNIKKPTANQVLLQNTVYHTQISTKVQ